MLTLHNFSFKIIYLAALSKTSLTIEFTLTEGKMKINIINAILVTDEIKIGVKITEYSVWTRMEKNFVLAAYKFNLHLLSTNKHHFENRFIGK